MDDSPSRVTVRFENGDGDRDRVRVNLDGLEIQVVSGPDAGARKTVTSDLVRIGAGSENDLVLTDQAASRRHAEVRRSEDGLELHDLDSTNGTRIGGQRVRVAPLVPGDEFEVGQNRLRVRVKTEERHVSVVEVDHLGSLVGATPSMRRLFALLRAAGPTGATVLVTGETGTGKELVARELHRLSGCPGPCVTFDSSATEPSQVASALFGHRRGAFTGAVEARTGAARRAVGGTLFLDEVGEIPLDLQPRLLRLLEAREVTPMGADEAVPVDLRIVAATNRDLEAEVAAGTFRLDLLHRLAVIEVQIPPLRERIDDLPLLVEAVTATSGGRPVLTKAAWERLRAHPWPGNVRELRNRLERALALSSTGTITPEDLGLEADAPASGEAGSNTESAPYERPPPPSLEEVEQKVILEALERNGGHQRKTAEELGVSLTTLKRRIRQLRKAGKLPAPR